MGRSKLLSHPPHPSQKLKWHHWPTVLLHTTSTSGRLIYYWVPMHMIDNITILLWRREYFPQRCAVDGSARCRWGIRNIVCEKKNKRFNNKKFTGPSACECVSVGGCRQVAVRCDVGRGDASCRGRFRKNLPAGNHSSPGVKLSFGKINPPRYGWVTMKNEIL